jgi:hypothetical protein
MTMTKPHKKWFFLAVWCMAFAFGGCGGPTAVPTSYSTYSDDQKIFKIQYPDGWACESGSRDGFSRAKFSSGNAVIEVESDVATRALISEIAQTGILPVSPGDPSSTMSARNAHWLEKTKFEEGNGVKEEKAMTATTKLGNGVKSEFAGENSFGGKIRGYRGTSMNNDKRIRVICRCPAEEWDSLKPVFDLVIESISNNS